MKSLFISIIMIFAVLVKPALAQQSGVEVVWIQVEAHPSLRVAQDRSQLYSGRLADVNGFALGGNWYGIVLGPYTRGDAERVLQVYKSERQIPQDAFITFTQNFGQQFWPVGADLLNTGAVPAPTDSAPVSDTAETNQAEPAQIIVADETPAEARNSERLLSREERMELQVALQSAGFYNSAIDGAFGRGTRASMADWQAANNYEETGILTTAQRQVLMDQYNAPLISVGMRLHTDAKAGIQMQMPMGAIAFDHYEPPFAHYNSTSELGARVLLISQPGDKATLYGLFDIMQTLEIVPLEGPRQKKGNTFTLVGRNRDIVSYTQAELKGGQIKGFTLIWPTGDKDRRARVLTAMKTSFTRTDGVLDPAEGGDSAQSIDLISGLQVRKPRLSRSGFFVDDRGTVLTTAEAVENCTRLTIDHDYVAEVVARDDNLGVAVLRPANNLAPMSVARFRNESPRLQADVTVSGYSYEGVLGAPTLTFGTLTDVKGLSGEANQQRLAMAAQPGDAGGPVIDVSGGVIGMLLPSPSNGRKLPDNVSLAAQSAALQAIMDRAGVAAQSTSERGAITPVEMNRLAEGMTVLVSCWD